MAFLNFPLATFIALFTLMLVTKGMEESGYLSRASLKILERIKNERKIALFLIALSAGLSTFLTNDITLFITIPLTLAVLKQVKKDLSKIIAFNALAVNVGSALTPIGNPQNLYLWHQWGISFWSFIWLMAPPVLLSLAVLSFFVFLSYSPKKVDIKRGDSKSVDGKMFLASLLFLLFFIIMMQIHLEYYAFVIVLTIYIMFYPNLIKKVDYILLFIFALIFLDFGALPLILNTSISTQNPPAVYLLSAVLSQVMSNVPATVFLSHLTTQRVALAWGVNVGGNGLFVASLANIIAMRLSSRKLLRIFHLYSIPFLVVTLLLVYLLFLL